MTVAATAPSPSQVFRAEYGHFIGGHWIQSDSATTISQINPATGAELGRIQAGNAVDVEKAVQAAETAFATWSQSAPEERQELLFEFARRLKARVGDYALMEALNNGKTITEATGWDIPNAITQFELFAGAAYTLTGESRDYPDATGIVHREPLGVCAQIIPWNVPLLMFAAKIAPALAAGNTVVLKPAETSCLSIMEFCAEMADIIPPGVVNVVTGYGADIGKPLVTHPLVRKVAFTGSVPTARKVIDYAATNVIPQTLELGGKSAQIVCASADIDAAVEGAALSTIFNKGEVCLAGSRVFVHESVREEFTEKLVRVLERVQIGDPLSPATQLGALASQAQFDKVTSYFDIARADGATIATGGEIATVAGFERGFFVRPTLLTDVDNSMRVAQEEIFGPVTCVLGWNDESEVIRAANDVDYGLAGGVWSKDLGEVHRLSRAMQTGTVWVNRYFNAKTGMALGGYKQSGYGREFSHDILRDYTHTKSVVINHGFEGPLGIFGEIE
ncbi:aldehyde dehydrogenase family protein [Rhodococcus sp. (in: high G+C Gram-positive bacteria)]|uniref:aldehyde dehydrogenase family protein n=1 Tax=Rhodococcus sp. TaxID=1831 RepID=UPI00257DDCC1|nr:aldehyde dehydrogenase family protein [Rhodococcus sp. (in: high G+C Gram-positive bacteria)]MBQ9053055.1 aldehyde dehydrogenase [Rhodococcus sp. (in: high G+C Gram-positive bacteria)]